MKIRIVLTCFSLAFLAFVFSSSSGGRATSAGSGNTGAPGEATTCVTCHGGNSFTTSLAIQIYDQGTTTPITDYVPGMTYDMEVMISSTGSPAGYGFQMVALNSANNMAGSWSNPSSNTQIASANGRSYAEHNGVMSNNTFTTEWTAPALGTGNVTFYSGGNAVNGNGSTSGDGASVNTLTISEAIVNVSAGVATNINATDIADNGDGTDMEVSFDGASNENTISEYRIMVVKSANVGSFDLNAANSVSNSNYTVIVPDGSLNYTTTLAATTTDVDGDMITIDLAYQVFILSKEDGVIAVTSTLSMPSNELVLEQPLSTGFQENLVTVLTVLNKQLYLNIDANYLNDDLQLVIFDVNGRLIKQQNMSQTTNIIDLNHASSGVYWAVIRSGSQLWKRSFFVSK